EGDRPARERRSAGLRVRDHEGDRARDREEDRSKHADLERRHDGLPAAKSASAAAPRRRSVNAHTSTSPRRSLDPARRSAPRRAELAPARASAWENVRRRTSSTMNHATSAPILATTAGANGSANARVRAAASPRTESRARCEKEGLDPLRRAATIVQGRAEASVAMSPPAMAAAVVDDGSQKGRRPSPP